ncbi:MAG: hypothetical protein LUG90_07465 [Clostridiaceae bacterium]|nr:hypothetical protein [Clostridiaceae bacterium]
MRKRKQIKCFYTFIVVVILNSFIFFQTYANEVEVDIDTSISGGFYPSSCTLFVINKQNELWCYGSPQNGELVITDVAQVSNKGNTILKTDGSLWVLQNRTHETGYFSSDVEYVCMGSGYSKIPYKYAYDRFDGKIINKQEECDLLIQSKKIIEGPECTFAIKEDGPLWGGGDNSKGQLAHDIDCGELSFNLWTIGGQTDSIQAASCFVKSPIKIMDGVKYLSNTPGVRYDKSGIYAIKNDGTVWVWGDNDYIKTDGKKLVQGLNPETIKPRLADEELQDIKYITMGYEFSGGMAPSIIVKNDGTLWIKDSASSVLGSDYTLFYSNGILGDN